MRRFKVREDDYEVITHIAGSKPEKHRVSSLAAASSVARKAIDDAGAGASDMGRQHGTLKRNGKVIGRAQVLAVFPASKLGKVAGCKVIEGELRRNALIRLYRGSDVLYEGELASLRHEKDDVKEVRTGYECGVGFKSFSNIQVGDQLVCYVMEKSE